MYISITLKRERVLINILPFLLFSYLQTGGRNLQDLVCTLGNRRKFEEVQRCLDIIGFSHEVRD